MESTFMFLYSLAAWLDWPFSLELSSLISMKTRYWVWRFILCGTGSVRNLKLILHCLRYLVTLPLRLTYQSYILQACKYDFKHTWSIFATKLKPGMIAIHHTLSPVWVYLQCSHVARWRLNLKHNVFTDAPHSAVLVWCRHTSGGR